MKGKIIRYSIASFICLVIAFIILLSKGIFSQTETKDVMHILVDAFFVPGIIMLSFGILVFSTNEGTFDMLAYGVRRIFVLLKRNPQDAKYKTFYDYREAQRENKHQFGYLIIVGLFFTALSLLFLIFYYNV